MSARSSSHERLDRLAFASGAAGFVFLVTGVACIYWPAAFIVAGGGLLGWSYLTASAVSRARQQLDA